MGPAYTDRSLPSVRGANRAACGISYRPMACTRSQEQPSERLEARFPSAWSGVTRPAGQARVHPERDRASDCDRPAPSHSPERLRGRSSRSDPAGDLDGRGTRLRSQVSAQPFECSCSLCDLRARARGLDLIAQTERRAAKRDPNSPSRSAGRRHHSPRPHPRHLTGPHPHRPRRRTAPPPPRARRQPGRQAEPDRRR